MRPLAAITLLLLGGAAALAPAPAGASPRPVAGLRVDAVGPGRIALAWADRSRHERRYEVAVGGRGGHALRRRRNSERAVVRGLDPGTVYRFAVRPCTRTRCARPRRTAAATLLAPYAGPHPELGCDVFPPGDALNLDVSAAPRDPDSAAIVAQILADGDRHVHPDFGANRSYGIPYVVVPAAQPLVPVSFGAYGPESDRGPYPVPPGAPVEGGRRSDGDRHVLVVRRPPSPGGSCRLFELYRAFERGGARNRWSADSGASFDLGSALSGQRPAGWTSADAAGLPIFPGLVTYEEVASGEIDHAIRVTFERTRRGYYPPATHWASNSCNPHRPAMGMRLRLAASYDISGISGAAAVIARALKRYGLIVADNGSNFFISGSTDRRWNDANLNQLKSIPGAAFEVVKAGASEVSDC